MSDTETATPTVIEQVAALAVTLLARLAAHDTELAAARKADADADAQIADLNSKLADANNEISSLQQKVATQLDLTPLTNVMAQMQAAVNAPDDATPAPAAPAAPAEPVSVAAVPAAPVVTPTPTGEVTVDAAAGTSTHVADADGTSTVVTHATGDVTATDINGNPVAPTQTAVNETVDALTAAGVQLPAPV